MSFSTHEEIIEIYIKKINLESVQEVNDQNSFNIIKIAYKDFRDEKLPFDDFVTLGEYLFGRLSPKNKSSEFGLLLLEIAELGDEIRLDDHYESRIDGVKWTLIKLDKYFQNH
jgi:hypothetical protein